MRSPRYYGDTTTSPSPVVTNHYDSAGRIDWQTDQLGRKTSFDYTTISGSTTFNRPYSLLLMISNSCCSFMTCSVTIICSCN